MTQSMKAPARGLSAALPLAALALAALAVAGILAAAPWPAAADSVSSDPGYVAAMERLEAEDYAAAAALIEKLRSEEHTSELQSLMRISYAVFCLKKKKKTHTQQQQKT